MPDWQTAWRLLVTSSPLQAFTISLLATFFAYTVWSAAPATFTALESSLYDAWLRSRPSPTVHSALAIVARDTASEEQFGPGLWDRAVLAQLIVAAHEAGAAAIGLDHRFDHASPAQLGGAASDALFLEALDAASSVVLVYDADVQLHSDAAIFGHREVTQDPDHVTRRVPLTISSGTQSIPAFSSLVYDRFLQHQPIAERSLTVNSTTSVLINMVGDGSLPALRPIPWSSVWEAIQHHDDTRLASWFKDKAVVLLPNPIHSKTWLLPSGSSVDGMTTHLHRLNALLNHEPIREVGPIGGWLVALLLASLTSWCLLRFQGSIGLLVAGGIWIFYGVLIVSSLSLAGLVMPVAVPFTGSLLATIGAIVMAQLSAHQRMLLLEQDMIRLQQESAAVREALILRESRAEALQEDLETAKATLAQSTGQQHELTRMAERLRTELSDTQTQEEAVRRQLAQLEHQLHDLRATGTPSHAVGDAELAHLQQESRRLGIVTQDPSLLRLFHDVKKSAKSSLSVLLLGEPGTGKELFARAVHRVSPRSDKTFIAVNMAAISPELFESELFGHVKGSFTGATADRRGYFALADHGTIFLDEIGDLRLDHQSKLLRVLQDQSFYRVGATTPTTVDVRVVAATNRDLQRGVSEGWFREDLYFRLTGMVFHLPPLRERSGDIPVLVDIFLNELATQMGKPVPKLTNEALRMLTDYDWRGNVRELRQCLEQALVLHDGPLLGKESFRLSGDRIGASAPVRSMLPDLAGDEAVLTCLRQHDFDMQATAKTLGWDRSTVTQRLKGLCFQALVDANGDHEQAALAIAGDPSHLRTAELKLRDYYGHLQSVIERLPTAEEALADCRRRFKNLPERHFAAVETLVRRYFGQERPAPSSFEIR